MTRASYLRTLALAALCLAMAVGTAYAQRGPGGDPGGRPGDGPGGRPGGGGFAGRSGGPGGGAIGLLRSDLLRQELGITDEQAQKIRETAEQAMQSGREAFRGLRDLGEEERRERVKQLREQAKQQMNELEQKIAEIIGSEKFMRLKEIELQLQGVGALRRPEVLEFVGLTDDQKAKLKELAEQNSEQMRGIREGARDMSPEERKGLREKMKNAHQELEKSVMGVLTDEQKQKLGELMGEPFPIDKLREQMQQGGGRRPQGGGDARGRGDRGGRGDRSRRPQRPQGSPGF